MSARKQKKNKKKRKASTTLKRYPYRDSNQIFSAEDINNFLEDRGSFNDEDYVRSEDSDLLDNDYDDKEYYEDDF